MPRIILVDDDPHLRTAIRRMLEPERFEIEEASDGRNAIRAFRVRPADLVLCDVFMPENDGLEVVRELAREFSGARVVAMSGGFRGTLNLLPMAQALGAADVLYKPFQRAELLAVVRRLLSTPRPSPAAFDSSPSLSRDPQGAVAVSTPTRP
jgi:DNA-binding response OmpR family regulator